MKGSYERKIEIFEIEGRRSETIVPIFVCSIV
jgi:hypothetical protein